MALPISSHIKVVDERGYATKEWYRFFAKLGGGGGSAGSSVLNVVDFGAIGNGSADDTAAIQGAMNAATVGSAIYFPPGNYIISATITMPSVACECFGEGIGVSNLIRNFAVGDLIQYPPQAAGFVNFHSLDLGAQVTCTSGAQLNLQGSVVGACTYGHVRDLYVHAGGAFTLYDGIVADTPNATMFSDISIRDVTHVGFTITCVFSVSQGLYSNITISVNTGTCMLLQANATHGFVGPVFDNIICQGGAYGVFFDPNGGQINEGRFSNLILDSHTSFGLYFDGSGAAGGGIWAFANVLCGVLTGQSMYMNSRWNGMLFSSCDWGSGATIAQPNVRLAGAKNVRFVNSILAGSGNASVNNVAVRFENDGAAVCDQISFNACTIGFDQNGVGSGGINVATYGLDASAHDHTKINIMNCSIYGSTDPVAFNGLGANASVVLRGNRYNNLAGTPTKPVAASTLRGSDWFFAAAAGVADTYEACTKDAANVYAWRTLI